MTDLQWMSAHDLSQQYRAGTVSPVEAVEAALGQLERANPAINAFVTVTADAAREQAREAEARLRSGEQLPPLFGIPITVKDLTDTAGVRTTYGSTAFAEHVPDTDGLEWERLKAAGTILIGKTTTPEFGLLGVTESKLTGVTSTPWGPGRTSGGSSGGAAAAVASGIAPLAWGSDGGGSIRVPSSMCGAVGVKASTGRIAHAGNSEPDTTEGPITRVVVDAAMMLDVTVGPDPRDRLALPATGESYVEAALSRTDLAGMRIAASADLGGGPVDPQTRAVFLAALDQLRAMGATVEEVPIELPDPYDYFVQYWGPEYLVLEAEMIEAGTEVWPLIAEIAGRARELSVVDVSRGVRETKTAIYDAYAGVFSSFDVLVTPTTPYPAFEHSPAMGLEVVDGVRATSPALDFHRMTESPSHAGLPALTLPCGFSDLNLPIGLQIIGPLHQDALVVSVAGAYERATRWFERRPSF